MDVEKRASKGGFLQLFDWNVKSRKKLVSSKSELPESSEQGNKNFTNSMILHPQLMEVHENGPGPRSKRESQYNCASSVDSDEGYGTKAPGVVARLMGLNSMPTSTISEPCPTPFCDSPFIRDSYSQRSTSKFQIEHQIVNTMPNGEISRKLEEPRLLKGQSRPIERFQTETLPLKSAKSIPISHHRMLSPIKSPGFIPRNNVTYIMEASAKIIEQGRPSKTKGKMPCYGSSSVPLRILDLKERMESAQKASGLPEASRKPKVPISFEYNKVPLSEKNQSGSRETRCYNASVGSVKDSSVTIKNKEKSVSLAVQAKVNVQSREGLTSNGNKSSINQKEGDEVRLGKYNKSQINMQKSVKKRTSDVLKQNNQKQNCVANTERGASKASVSNQQERKAPSSNDSVRSNKASNKVPNSATGSRNINSVAKNTGKKILSSKTKMTLENKRPLHRHIHSDESFGKTLSFSNDEKSVKCNIANDVCLNWDIVDSKSSMDVVSFTFTSPIKRSAPGSQSSGQVMEKNPRFCVDSCGVIGGDALSVLLEQKLKELTCRVESSDSNLVDGGSASCSAFSLQDSVSTLDVINTTSKDHHNSFQLHLHKDKSNHPHDMHCASVDGLLLKAKQKWQGLEDMEGHNISSDNGEYGKELDFQYPSPISNLDYNSSDCKASSITIGCRQSLLSVFQPMEVEIELSDSASSISAACVGGTDTSPTFCLIDFSRSPNWELDYINKILHNSDLAIEDFVLDRVNKVITPSLFDQLANPKAGYDENAEEYSKLERKVLFDCVRECLEARSGQLFGGSYKACSRWAALSRGNRCLAEELYKEISSWTSMGEGDLMVDELVDKDMSSWHGRWVDFGIEAFEEGADIEKEILTSLVDELVDDF
ncbi:uncharacterized protein LOC130779009 [Actinidia eriantha]|uniref:uncharacterized protein LOC130779009 n=1 Tax=Actinidia eriantha TaxID=165200 RepID=UPI0025901E7D|nr:uncharacterized protein LOC130779009 [Actinidia eriantha]XP_057493503.1 uncharacterized protein LOC130779009 [Actinidia eriantha]